MPTDYRLRHPITLQEADHTLELFIGSNRGELNPTQRAQVLAFGLGWKREATGGIVVERPVGSTNEHAAADAMREIVSILAASGLPPQSVVVQTYPATGPNLATVRISYPRIRAQAGPCGMWPKDIGPSMNRDYFENQPPWNYGCATPAQSRRRGRQSGRSRAAARRDRGLHDAAHHRVREISPRAKAPRRRFAVIRKSAKISDVGK